MRWRKPLVCVFVTPAMLVPMAPATAVNEYLCDGVPSSGFADVASNPFEPFIDCLVWWDNHRRNWTDDIQSDRTG